MLYTQIVLDHLQCIYSLISLLEQRIRLVEEVFQRRRLHLLKHYGILKSLKMIIMHLSFSSIWLAILPFLYIQSIKLIALQRLGWQTLILMEDQIYCLQSQETLPEMLSYCLILLIQMEICIWISTQTQQLLLIIKSMLEVQQ